MVVCDEIIKKNEINWKERKEKENDEKKKNDEKLEKERRLYRAKLQKETFLRNYARKKKEMVVWTKEKLDEKKSFWRKYREKVEEFELDDDEKLNMIGSLMMKIPERRPKNDETSGNSTSGFPLCANVLKVHSENENTLKIQTLRSPLGENAKKELCENDFKKKID